MNRRNFMKLVGAAVPLLALPILATKAAVIEPWRDHYMFQDISGNWARIYRKHLTAGMRYRAQAIVEVKQDGVKILKSRYGTVHPDTENDFWMPAFWMPAVAPEATFQPTPVEFVGGQPYRRKFINVGCYKAENGFWLYT